MVEITKRGKRVGLRLPVDVSGQDVSGSPFAESTESVNVSGGGLCYETQRTLGVGSRLTLDVYLPPALRKHFGGKPVFHARGVVCRVEASPSQTAFRVGVRFLAEVGA